MTDVIERNCISLLQPVVLNGDIAKVERLSGRRKVLLFS